MTDKQTPKRRFKEFENAPAWEQRKIGEISEITTGGTPSTEIKEYWTPKEIPWLSSGEVHKKYIFKADEMISTEGYENSSTKMIKENSVLIALAGQGKTRGTVAINRIPLATNQSIAAMTFNREIYPEFAFQNLESRYDELRAVSSGDGSRGGLNKQLIANIMLPCPTIEEQKQIGDFLYKLDETITLHQCKLEKLQNLKKAYLQEMFPSENENVPKRRFKGFTSPWEQRKLSEITNRFDNLRVPVAANLRIPGKTPYYGANGIQDYVEGYTHDGEYILIAEDGANDLQNYPIRYVNGRIWVNNHAHVLQGKDNINNRFIGFAIGQAKIGNLLVGGSRAKLNAEDLMNIEIKLPSLREQEMISKLLRNIDETITLHQCKLDKLKALKQAYLKEMFP